MDESFSTSLVSLSQHLLQYILDENTEVVLEVVKALSNLTRNAWVLESMAENGFYTDLIELAQSRDSCIQQTTLGVLVNASSHPASRECIMRSTADEVSIASKLVVLLRRTSLKAIISSTLICKVRYSFMLLLGIDNVLLIP
jgi:hypothetical protein